MAEEIGGVNVTISGDYGPLVEDLAAAQDVAAAGAGKIAGAFDSAAGAADTFEQRIQALIDSGSTLAEALAKVTAADVAKPIAEAGTAAATAATQLDLFGAAMDIPYADATGQLNLFSGALEPIAGTADTASEALQSFSTNIPPPPKLAESKGAMDSLTESVGAMGGTFKEVGGFLSEALTIPLAAVSAALIKVGLDMDESSDTIRAKTGLIGTDLESMNASFDAVAANVPNKLGDVTDSLVTLHTRLGLMGEPLEAMSTQVLNLSRVTGESLAPLVDTTAKVFQRWKIDTEDQSGALDKLYYASTQTGTGVGMMLGLLRQFAPALQEMGFTFDQAVALISKFDQAGLNTQRDITALQQAIMKLGKAGIADPIEAMQLLVERIQNAGSTGEANAIGLKTFGRGALDMVEAIRSGKLNLDDFVKSMQGHSGAINTAAADTLSFADKLKLLGNDFEVAARPAAEAFLKALEGLLDGLKPVIDEVGRLSKAFAELDPDTQKIIIGVAAVAAAAGPAAIAVGAFMTAIAAIAPGIALALPVIGEIAFALAAIKLTGADQAIFDFADSMKRNLPGLVDLVSPITDAVRSLNTLLHQISPELDVVKESGTAMINALLPGFSLMRDALKVAADALDYLGGRDKAFEEIAKHEREELEKGTEQTLALARAAGDAATAHDTHGVAIGKVTTAAGLSTTAHGSHATALGGVSTASGTASAALDKLLGSHQSTIKSLGQLIADNKILTQDLTLAQGVYDAVTARVKAGSGEYNLQSEALKQLEAARKKLGETETDANRISDTTQEKTQTLIDKTYAQVDATQRMIDKYGEGDTAVHAAITVRDGFLKQLGLTVDQFKLEVGAAEAAGVAHQELGGHLKSLGTAFKDLGITSSAALKEMADKAHEKYLSIKADANSTIGDISAAEDADIKKHREWQDSLDPVAAAFKGLGIVSSEALRKAAEDAHTYFDRIATDGKSAPVDITRAWDAWQAKQRSYNESLGSMADAYKTLGITSLTELKRMADADQAAYERISADSSAGAGVVAAAHKRMNDSADAYHEGLTGIPPAQDAVGKSATTMGMTAGRAWEKLTQDVLNARASFADVNAAFLSMGSTFMQQIGAMDAAWAKFAQGVGSFSPNLGLGPVTGGGKPIAQGDLSQQPYDQLFSDWQRNQGLQFSAGAQLLAQAEYQELQRRWANGDFGSAGASTGGTAPAGGSGAGGATGGSTTTGGGGYTTPAVGLKAGSGTPVGLSPSMTIPEGGSSGIPMLDAISGGFAQIGSAASMASGPMGEAADAILQVAGAAQALAGVVTGTVASILGASGPAELINASPSTGTAAGGMTPVGSGPLVLQPGGTAGPAGSGVTSGFAPMAAPTGAGGMSAAQPKPTGWTDAQWSAFQSGGSDALTKLAIQDLQNPGKSAASLADAQKSANYQDTSKMQWSNIPSLPSALGPSSSTQSALDYFAKINEQWTAQVSGGGGTVVNVTVNNPTVTNQSQLDQMVKQIQDLGIPA